MVPPPEALEAAAAAQAPQAPPSAVLLPAKGKGGKPGSPPAWAQGPWPLGDVAELVIQGSLASMPQRPDTISDVRPPKMELTRVSRSAFDVRVIHSFRAHFAGDVSLPVTLGQFRPALNLADEGGWLPRGSDSPPGDAPGSAVAGDPVDTALQASTVPLNSAATAPGDALAAIDEEAPVPQPLATGRMTHSKCVDTQITGSSHCQSGVWGDGAPAGVESWLCDPSQVVLGKRLAIGGFAEVFLGKYEGTVVAVKVLREDGEKTMDQLKREVTVLASLRHPHLLLFMGFCLQPRPAMLSEFMHRGSLFKVLRSQGDQPLEPRLQRAFALSVARGMAYLHTRQPPVLHFDLKSPNILVDDRWRFKVADFGLARLRHQTILASGDWGSTPEWAAPEVIRCEECDEAADVYSYGVCLWEVLTGQEPWKELMSIQVIAAVGFQGRRLELPAGCDPELAELYEACVQRNPRDRPTFPVRSPTSCF